MPHATQVNAINDAFGRVIEPYAQPGNRIANDMYDDLELPWAADPAQMAFPKGKFRRFDWDRGGSQDFPMEILEQARGASAAGGHGARLHGGGLARL